MRVSPQKISKSLTESQLCTILFDGKYKNHLLVSSQSIAIGINEISIHTIHSQDVIGMDSKWR